MKPVRAIWIALVGAAVVATHPAPAALEDYEIDYGQISQAGQEIIDRFAPDSFKNQYEFASAEDLKSYFAPMQAALAGESVAALAALQPQARQTLTVLRANPGTQAYADWLEARLDFFEMAVEVEKAIPAPIPTPAPTPTPGQPPPPPAPAPSKPLPPHPAPPSKPLPPHPTTPQPPLIPHPQEPAPQAAPAQAPVVQTPPPAVEKARNRYVESKQSWLRKLAGRPAPARAAALLPELKRAFQAEGVPAALVWQAEAESTFNPAARSPSGAVGLYQFMPATAQQFGLRVSPDDERLDAVKNARAAAKYLKMLHTRFGNWPLAFAAYNCGQGRVSNLLRTTGGRTFDDIQDRLPAETRMYVPKIAALVQMRENMDLETL